MGFSTVLESAGSWFPGTVSVVQSNSVMGLCRGYTVTLSFTNRGYESNPDPWTEVEVRADLRGVSLELRPQTHGEAALEAKGHARDIRTGDAHFDQAYVVEGAPADIILAWLDADLRARLLALGGPTVELGDSAILTQHRGWVHDPAVLGGLIDIAAGLAASLPAAVETANHHAQGYRGNRPDENLGRARLGDLAQLEATKARRAEHNRRRAIKIGGVIAAILFIWIVGAVVVPIVSIAATAAFCYYFPGSCG